MVASLGVEKIQIDPVTMPFPGVIVGHEIRGIGSYEQGMAFWEAIRNGWVRAGRLRASLERRPRPAEWGPTEWELLEDRTRW